MELLPFNPDEILSARETFRRLSALRRASRQKAAEYGPTRVYTRADAPTCRPLPPLPKLKQTALPSRHTGAPAPLPPPRVPVLSPEEAKRIADQLRAAKGAALPKRQTMITERQEARHAREGTKIAALFKLQERRCYLCACEFTLSNLPTVDHVKPRARGGRNAYNVLLACQPCNQEKADRPPTEAELATLRRVNDLLRNTTPEEQPMGSGQAHKASEFTLAMEAARDLRLAV